MPVKHFVLLIQYSWPASDCRDGKNHQNDSASLGHSEIHRLEREGEYKVKLVASYDLEI